MEDGKVVGRVLEYVFQQTHTKLSETAVWCGFVSHVCHSCFAALPITSKKIAIEIWNSFIFRALVFHLIVSLWKRILQHILLPISSFYTHIIYFALAELMKHFVLTNVDGIRVLLFPQNSMALTLQSFVAKIRSHFQNVWCWLQTKMMFRKMPTKLVFFFKISIFFIILNKNAGFENVCLECVQEFRRNVIRWVIRCKA